ncbi:D,D-heptose 1,7-bisphosphate phosphatase [Paenibacillus faecis]|uniref:HAD-IIIA family hydrolase n=1 Tax=Paenibacillus faecis TaxID=862114 RepID=UPI001B24C014|nr:HAD-IIIA family hydrolase [Paenibacillus faecis]GIO84026.1 D,D-heptose 1,7-bisphosphate phosphatase [Paenibacillus faecis]
MLDWQAVFIDRDGTIGGTGHFIHPRDFVLYQGSQESIQRLKKAGLKVFAFTNQTRISRGEATEEEFKSQFKTYGFDDSFICPHEKHEGCNCRKPSPEMLFAAAEKYGLDLSRCVVIGDVGDADMLAAHSAGAKKVLVRMGKGERSLNIDRDKWKNIEPDLIANDINEAVKWILEGRS